MSELEDETRGFKVTDRRSFTSEGERRPTSPVEPVEELSAEENREETSSRPEQAPPVAQSDVHFLDLLSLLATQATLHLGQLHPEGEEPREDLPAARMMIAMIESLKEKTKGNLSEEEGSALSEVLYQLRLEFVARAKGRKV